MTATAVLSGEGLEADLRWMSQNIRTPNGKPLGDAFETDPWLEHDVLRPILATDEEGYPLHKIAGIVMHRGSGKSTIAGAVGLCRAVRYPNSLIIAIGADREQADLICDAVRGFCYENALLNAAVTQRNSFFRLRNRSLIKTMASDAPSFYGQALGVKNLTIIADELAQWQRRDLLDAALSTLPKVRRSQLVVLSNAPILGSWQAEFLEMLRDA